MKNNLLLLVFALMLGLSGFAQQPAQKNLSLIGQLPYNNMNLNDVWAYVDGNGNEYALVGGTNGTSIVSLADPSNPTELFYIPGPFSTWRDLKTFQNYAYVSNETDEGLLIIDLSDLPNSIDWKDTVIQGVNTIHNLWMTDGYLYVVGCDNFNGGMMMLDLNNNPWIPEFVGAYTERYVHDVYVRDDIAYAGEIEDGLLTIIDVSNKANPTVLGQTDYINSFTHNTWLNDAGDVCFTTDELDAAYIYAWDVSDPTDIKQLDRIRSSLSNGDATPHNAHVLNDFIITSYYKDGINIIDASNPNNLVEVGYYDTSPLTGGGTDGCWGAYPFLPSGVILGTDMNEGLFVLQPNYVRGCYLEALVEDANTTVAIAGADVTLQTPQAIQGLSNATGEFSAGTPDPGTYNLNVSKFGYQPATVSVSLTNGQTNTITVPLTPAPSTPLQITVLEEGSNLPIADAILLAQATDGELTYTTNQNGEINVSNFVIEDYTFIVGHWGHKTIEMQQTVDSTTGDITIYLDRGYYDDFVLDFNWQISGDATLGLWERADPIGTQAQGTIFNPDMDVMNDIGDLAYVTGNGGGGIGNDDVDNGTTIFRSQAMDLTDYTNPEIAYYWWFINVDFSGSPENDYLSVELVGNGNSVEIARYTGQFNAWTPDTILVSDYMTPSSNMFIRFITLDQDPGDVVEAAIDKFEVLGANPATTAINELHTQQLFELYPNPVKDQLNLRYDVSTEGLRGGMLLEVIDMRGSRVMQADLNNMQGELSLPFHAKAGVYMAVIRHEGEVVARWKVVK